MIINIINLDPDRHVPGLLPQYVPIAKKSREERILSVVKQSKEQGFTIKFWEGVIEKHGFIGISKAFKKIVQYAKDNNLPKVCIAEDDIFFTAPLAWQYYLDNMPEDFDTYLGGIFSGTIQDGRITNGYSGNTLITINQKFYDFFLSAKESDSLDRWLGNFAFEKRYMVCEPFVVKQLQGYSENHRRIVSHEAYLAGKVFFGG